MAGGAERITQDPMAANDALVAVLINNLNFFEEKNQELVITNFTFKSVGNKTIALIIPRNGELDLSYLLPPEEKTFKFETTNGPRYANPAVLTDEQEKKLMETGRVRRVRLQLSPRDVQELGKTVMAND